jgi:hypothetical protein
VNIPSIGVLNVACMMEHCVCTSWVVVALNCRIRSSVKPRQAKTSRFQPNRADSSPVSIPCKTCQPLIPFLARIILKPVPTIFCRTSSQLLVPSHVPNSLPTQQTQQQKKALQRVSSTAHECLQQPRGHAHTSPACSDFQAARIPASTRRCYLPFSGVPPRAEPAPCLHRGLMRACPQVRVYSQRAPRRSTPRAHEFL